MTKNLYSFKDETEFNLLPNKTQRLQHHKVSKANFDFLRFGAIYGANGSGKSNLIRAISLLESMVEIGQLPPLIDDIKFKLDQNNSNLPISFGIEFIANDKAYFYTISFDNNLIINEYLARSFKDNDELLFERNIIDGKQSIKFFDKFYSSDKDKLFVEVLSEKLIEHNQLLITFIGNKYSNELKEIWEAYNWFDETLVIIGPNTRPEGIAHLLDQEEAMLNFANSFMLSLNTGISEIEIEKSKLDDFFGKDVKNLKKSILDDIEKDSNSLSVATHSETGEEVSFVNDDSEVIVKRLITKHKNSLGENVDFYLGQESDGIKRLIDYIPAFQEIIHKEKVYIIDEIERSLHPITIKEIISKLTLDENVEGQLIFSTHESNLLDQEILRPDEIWFAQKDLDGSSKLYSLSDFKIHNTIDIENGYLKGRFGGIPFLSNLKDLNW